MEPNGDVCTKCGAVLLFSAREIGDGLCHACAHKEVPVLRALLQEEIDRLSRMIYVRTTDEWEDWYDRTRSKVGGGFDKYHSPPECP